MKNQVFRQGSTEVGENRCGWSVSILVPKEGQSLPWGLGGGGLGRDLTALWMDGAVA